MKKTIVFIQSSFSVIFAKASYIVTQIYASRCVILSYGQFFRI